MRRIKSAGKGYVTLDGVLINLSEYKFITQDQLGFFELEQDGQRWSIGLTPNTPSSQDVHDNVDGTWYITYKENEKKDFEADYKTLLNSQKEDKWWSTKNILKYLVFPLAVGLILWAIAKKFP